MILNFNDGLSFGGNIFRTCYDLNICDQANKTYSSYADINNKYKNVNY